MSERFGNQVVVITGASSGIGESLARAFAREGAELVLVARRKAELDRVARSCVGARQVHVVPCDLSDVGSIPTKADEIIRLVGHVDVVVHNAGISQRSLVLETSLEVDRRIMELNFFAPVALTKALLPHMLRVKGGRFVVVSSLVGLMGVKLRSTYSASKHALHGFFETLEAEHHADGIRVTLVCPGFVATNIAKNAVRGDGSAHGHADEANASGLDPDDVAASILTAVHRGRAFIAPAGKEGVAVYLKRIAPSLVARIMRNQPAR